jgi:serine/threonine-protein kinase PknG
MTVCTQPGCGGTIQDGYCDVCGLAAPRAPAAGPHPRAAPAPAPGLSAGPAASPAAPTRIGRAPVPARALASALAPASAPADIRTGSQPGSRGSRPPASRPSRGSLGAGLVDIPPIPERDPASAVLADPQVAESRRFCGQCERPVGRGRDGRPGLAEGFCRHCGHPFSFIPKLEPGELVGGQYEVMGCLAHGGLGWIYLAKDRNVSDRWVVLKGLLDSGDADAMAAAVAERRFLAAVEHPSIVRIYNFVQHADRRSAAAAGYIVMEYAGGQSLRQILLERRKAGGSLPLPVALAYAIEVLPALGYLHSRGLVYCDFKPDNVIQTQEQLKLIDMGGVRRIDDDESPIYGTVGYQAPEIATDGPSPSSDLYTVARALAVLTFDFAGYQSSYAHSLPDPAKVPLLARHESFGRLLRRATDPDRRRRFATADEMAEQLTGVLREVVAMDGGHPPPAFSALFTPELEAIGAAAAMDLDGTRTPGAAPQAAEIVAGLPVPQVDSTDPAAGYLATLSILEPASRAAALIAAATGQQGTPPDVAESAETRLALARALIVTGDADGAATALAGLVASGRADWRVTWYQGMRELACGRPGHARAAFDAVLDVLPGELAPKLALALAAEASGDIAGAARYFQLVWTVDQSYVSAAFGLARMRLAAGDPRSAIAAIADVPETSRHHVPAQIAAVRLQLARQDQAPVTVGDLQEAGVRLGRLTLDPTRQHHLTAEILRAALDCQATSQQRGDGQLLGYPLTERALRAGLERSYRALAKLAADEAHRVGLVDLANQVRPRTWA